MRLLNIILCVLMLVFAAVQYNDPDGFIWMGIYAIPTIWAAIAAWRNQWLGHKVVHFLLLFCIFISVAGVLVFWPSDEGWWRQKVWWEQESAREGIGMMIVILVLAVVWFSRPRSRSRREK